MFFCNSYLLIIKYIGELVLIRNFGIIIYSDPLLAYFVFYFEIGQRQWETFWRS